MTRTILSPTSLNIAQVWPATRALGPGLRSAVWVQGCPRHCPGCISPEWIPQVDARQISPEELAQKMLQDPNVEGFTFSGGEPMLQAAGLAILARAARQQRTLNMICFTGYTLSQLMQQPEGSPVYELLSELDVLIDGPYIAELDNNRGLRGSTNQNIHHLTDRLKGYDFENGPRRAEIHIQEDYTMLVGVPPREVLQTVEQALETRGIRKIK